MAKIIRKLLSVGGLTSELLGIECQGGHNTCRPDHAHGAGRKPVLQLVVIPGNPGSATYFKPFMQMLYEQLGGQADVLAITQVGHAPDITHGGQVWSLDEQIDHKVAFLKEQVLLPGRPPVVLIAHSIGAYMALQAVRRVESEQRLGAAACGGAASGAAEPPPIIKVVGVFPFLTTDFTVPRQRRLRLCAARYNWMGLVAAALSWVPRWFTMAVVRSTSKDEMDEYAISITSDLFSRHSVRNNFYLAKHEFEALSQPFDWSLMRDLGARLHCMGCPEDTWLSRQQFDDMCAQVPGLQATWHDDLVHGFCVSYRQSQVLAEVVAGVAASGLELFNKQQQQQDGTPASLLHQQQLAGTRTQAKQLAASPRPVRSSRKSPSPAVASEADVELFMEYSAAAMGARDTPGVQTRRMAAAAMAVARGAA